MIKLGVTFFSHLLKLKFTFYIFYCFLRLAYAHLRYDQEQIVHPFHFVRKSFKWQCFALDRQSLAAIIGVT
jgi:hypothetical protein